MMDDGEKTSTVEMLMTRQVYSCRPGDSLQVVAELLRDLGCDCLPVTNDEGLVVGMITHRDLCDIAATEELALGALSVERAMTPQVVACAPDTSIVAALDLMREHRVHHLPVTDPRGRLVGLMSLGTIARCVSKGDDLGVAADAILAASIGERPRSGVPSSRSQSAA